MLSRERRPRDRPLIASQNADQYDSHHKVMPRGPFMIHSDVFSW
jgi:hypothetical protein